LAFQFVNTFLFLSCLYSYCLLYFNKVHISFILRNQIIKAEKLFHIKTALEKKKKKKNNFTRKQNVYYMYILFKSQ
jgi:hypothetical protein